MIDYKGIEEKYEIPIYSKRDIVITKGKNAKVLDENGKEYIDCIAGHGATNIGHCNDEVTNAIKNQSEILIACPNLFYNDKRAIILETLLKIAPKNLKKIFLCNSGTESIETAIKFARISTKKKNFLCAMRSFHGRTMGSLSATYNAEYREEFEPLVQGFSFFPFNDFEKLKEKADGNTAGIILEIVQGEGGVNLGNKEFFQKVKDFCNQKDILLIIDEVQTGFCRTGKMFACEHFEIEPDILCLAKSIANGFPMGAVLCSNKITIAQKKHGTTFGGNPLACAASLSTINFMLKNNIAKQSKEKGEYFISKLKENLNNSQKIREIRGIGLMIGIELKEKAKPYVVEMADKGLLALLTGSTVIRVMPPLTISHDEIDKAIEIITSVLK